MLHSDLEVRRFLALLAGGFRNTKGVVFVFDPGLPDAFIPVDFLQIQESPPTLCFIAHRTRAPSITLNNMQDFPPKNENSAPQPSPHFPNRAGDGSIPSLQQEKQRILSVTLPEAYHALGKDCIQNKRHLESVPQLVSELNAVLAELKSMRDVGLDKIETNGVEASTKTPFVLVSEKRNGLIAKIGLTIFTSYGDDSGPPELVEPIRNSLSRIETIANLEAQSYVTQRPAATNASRPSAKGASRETPYFPSAETSEKAKEVLVQGVDIARKAFRSGSERLRSTFGAAMKDTISCGFSSFGEVLARPIRHSFGTIVLIIACALSVSGLFTIILIPVFFLGYIPYVESILKREPASLGKFISFMRHGWDSLWHLLMLLGTFFIAAAMAIAPFLIAGIIVYATFGTLSMAGLQVVSLVPSGSSSVDDKPIQRDFGRNLGPIREQDNGVSQKDGFMTHVLRALSSLMENAVWVVTMLLLGLVATAVLTPSGSILILVYCITLMVATRKPVSDVKYDLVYEAFERMLLIAQTQWKRLLTSGLWLVALPIVMLIVTSLLSALMLQLSLPFFAAWISFVVLPLLIFGFVIYVNVFSVKTAMQLVDSPSVK